MEIDSPEEIAEIRAFFRGLPDSEQRRLIRYFAEEFGEPCQEPNQEEKELEQQAAIELGLFPPLKVKQPE